MLIVLKVPEIYLPYFEAELVLLPAPDLEAGIVAAELPEELGADGEEAARHHGALEGLGGVLQVLGQQRQPLVEQLPVKGPPGALVLGAVLEVVVVHHVYEGTHGGSVVLRDGVQQRGQPVNIGLGVGVQEDDDLGSGLLGSLQPGGDEAASCLHSHHRHLRQLGDVLVQLDLQLGLVAGVVHEDHLLEQVVWRPVDDAVEGSEQRGPVLVVEGDDHGDGGQVGVVQLAPAPGVPDVGHRALDGDQVAANVRIITI